MRHDRLQEEQRDTGDGGSPPDPPRRRHSQNFLVDRGAAERIVERFAPQPADHVLEIGPGRGALTRLVAGRVARLVAVEVDPRLAAGLERELAGTAGLELRHADVLELPLAALRAGPPLRVLSNLPYHISSPVVLKLCEESGDVNDATLMLQLEYAERLAASSGGKEYGSITVLVQSRFRVTTLLDLGPSSFRPRPRVHSRLLRLESLVEPLVPAAGWEPLKRLLRMAFSARRKRLDKTLATGLGRERDEVRTALLALGVDPGCRPETLPPPAWATLAATFYPTKI